MGVTLAGGNISCPKAPEKEDKLREDGGINGVKDLLPPRISCAEDVAARVDAGVIENRCWLGRG